MDNSPYKISIRLHTARGFCTRYAHACGYLDTATIDKDREAITMGLDGCYFVRAHDPVSGKQLAWEVFDCDGKNENGYYGTGRKAAQKFFMETIKKYHATRNKPSTRTA